MSSKVSGLASKLKGCYPATYSISGFDDEMFSFIFGEDRRGSKSRDTCFYDDII